MTRRCETCRFWGFLRQTEPHVEIGECRRHAPKATTYDLANAWTNRPVGRADWPLTMFDDWCGEHVSKWKQELGV